MTLTRYIILVLGLLITLSSYYLYRHSLVTCDVYVDGSPAGLRSIYTGNGVVMVRYDPIYDRRGSSHFEIEPYVFRIVVYQFAPSLYYGFASVNHPFHSGYCLPLFLPLFLGELLILFALRHLFFRTIKNIWNLPRDLAARRALRRATAADAVANRSFPVEPPR